MFEDYFSLWAPGAAPFSVTPARSVDMLEHSSGEVKIAETYDYKTMTVIEGGLRCERVFGPTGGTERRFGHIQTPPLAHPWLLFDLLPLLGLTVRQGELLLDGSIVVVARAPTGAPSPGTLLRVMEADDLRAEYGETIDLRTGAIGLRTLAWLWQLPACEERLERLERGEMINPPSVHEPLVRDDVLSLVRHGRRVAARFRALGLAPANGFLDVLPIGPIAFRPPPPAVGHPDATHPEVLLRLLVTTNHRLARLREAGAPRALVEAEARRLQEQVFDLFTVGIVRMAVTAGLFPETIVERAVEALSEVPPPPERRDPDGDEVAPINPRAPHLLMVWGRRVDRSLNMLRAALTRSEPRSNWIALLRSSGVAVDAGG